MNTPDPGLIPPEFPVSPLRCCLCGCHVPEALELYYGILCRECLISCLCDQPLEEAAALLCAAVLEDGMLD